MDGYIGTIMLFGGNFAPRNWAFCSGQLLAITEFTALYSILGTTYGGDGRTTFGLPNLKGRAVVGQGTSSSGYNYRLGNSGGFETSTLDINHMPPHSHPNTLTTEESPVIVEVAIPSVSNSDANLAKPVSPAVLGKMSGTSMYSNATPDNNLLPFNATGTITPAVTINNANAGGGAAFSILQPYSVLNYIICLQGMFPARN